MNKKASIEKKELTIWLTGLSGAGKTTIALALEKELLKQGFLCRVLDGDDIRKGINKDLGFSSNDRKENIRRVAEISKLFMDLGIIVITAFITPTNELRSMAREIIGKNRFFQVYLNTPLEVCEKRDVKGLYAKARQKKIPEFTGISAPFETPKDSSLVLDTSKTSLKDCINKIIKNI